MRLTSAVWIGLVCSASVISASPVARAQEVRLTASFEQESLRSVLRSFAPFAGRTIVLYTPPDHRITAAFRNLPWRAALDSVLAPSGLVAIEDSLGILHVRAGHMETAASAVCPMMGVPLFVGTVSFVDSVVETDRGLGIDYRFGDHGIDAFRVSILPSGSRPPLSEFFERIAGGLLQRFPSELLEQGRYAVRIGPRGADGGVEVPGYLARYLQLEDSIETHFAVFGWRDRYVQFLLSHEPGAAAGAQDFIYRVLAALSARPIECPI